MSDELRKIALDPNLADELERSQEDAPTAPVDPRPFQLRGDAPRVARLQPEGLAS